MFNPLKQLGVVGLTAAFASPIAAQNYTCRCGAYAPMPSAQTYPSYQADNYVTRVGPSVAAGYAVPRARAPHLTPEYYTPNEANVLYHPVVVPLDEFLRPGEPASLTRDQLQRQRAAADARATPPQPQRVAAPTATTPEADPFADDATAVDASAAPAVPVEQPAREAAPLPTPPQATPPQPAAEPAEQDPFESLEATE